MGLVSVLHQNHTRSTRPVEAERAVHRSAYIRALLAAACHESVEDVGPQSRSSDSWPWRRSPRLDGFESQAYYECEASGRTRTRTRTRVRRRAGSWRTTRQCGITTRVGKDVVRSGAVVACAGVFRAFVGLAFRRAHSVRAGLCRWRWRRRSRRGRSSRRSS